MAHRSRLAAILAVLLPLAACQDGTGPQPAADDLTLEVTAYPGQTYLLTTADGMPAAGCNFVFSLNPTGTPGTTAAWAGGTLRFFAGADRTAPFDSVALTPEEMDEHLGAGLRAGTRQSGTLPFLASVPFGLEAEFRYTVQGSVRSVTEYAPCTVSVADAGAPPSVSDLQVSVQPGLPLEAGDRVRATWTASSTPGLWETGVVVTGAFEAQFRLGALHQKEKTFTVEFRVPRNALLGEPVRVHAYARDLLVRASAPLSEAVGPVVDVTAPTLLGVSTTGGPGDVLRGMFESGRGIPMGVLAQEGGALSYLVYETGPAGATVRDSVPLDTVGAQSVSLPTRTGWSGAGELRLYVRDNAGNRSRTVQAAPGDLSFYPARPVQTREARLPYAARAFAADGARGWVAVAAQDQPRVYVYGLQGLAQVAAVDLSVPALRVEFAPDGQLAAALGGDMMAFIDVAGQRVARYVPLTAAPVDSIYGFGITTTGRALVLARRLGGGAVVLEYDLATGTQRVRSDAPAIPYPDAGVATSLDASRVMLGAGCIYRVDTDTFGACSPLWHGGEYRGGRFSGSGTGAYWTEGSRLFDASLRQVRATGVSALSADDRYAYVADYDRILRVRLSDGQIEDALTSFVHLATRTTADGRFLVSLGQDTSNQYQIRVVDLP